MQHAVPVVVMRGGTSKGLYFLRDDLPTSTAARDAVLLAAMGSPDPRQIDGLGGAHPLTSKVAIVSPGGDARADIDYLFLQVHVEAARVSDGQNCGNILAGVAQFAIEQGLIAATSPTTTVRVRLLNTDGIAAVTVQTPGGQVTYAGETAIDGVPGTAAPVFIDFASVAGSNCGALLPTGRALDHIDGVGVTCIDNGMPVVVVAAADLGRTGEETPSALESDASLRQRVEAIRREAGHRMNLGDVEHKTVPKVSLVAPPRAGGTISTRTFIPHRVHQAIGVLGAASVAAACRVPGSAAAGNAVLDDGSVMVVEHPSGALAVDIALSAQDGETRVERSALVRTARKLMAGTVFVPAHAMSGT